jgi:hypothetical protein
MTKPMVRIHDQSTDEIVDREMTDEEFEQWTIEQNEHEAKAQAEATKSQNKTALLDRLGITAEEAALLLG